MTITKTEIATRVCEKTNLSKHDATNLVARTFEIIKVSLERGEPEICGFDSFIVRVSVSARDVILKAVLRRLSLSARP